MRERTEDDDITGASEPEQRTPHRSWVRVVAILALALMVLSVVFASLPF